MGLEELRLKIEKETEAEALRIEEEGKLEAKQLIDSARTESSKQRQQFRERTKEVLDTIERRSVAEIDFENRRKVMMRRKQMLDEIFTQACKSLPSKNALVMSTLKKATERMPKATIFVSKGDIKLVPGAKEANIRGGLVAESADGTVRLDYSHDVFIEQAWQEHLSEIVEMISK